MVRDRYIRLFRQELSNVGIFKADMFRMTWFEQFPQWRVSEEWSVGIKSLGKAAGPAFWTRITELLTGNIPLDAVLRLKTENVSVPISLDEKAGRTGGSGLTAQGQ